ncbi:MAG: hypothetical protein WCO63_16475 [Bacteroidota bacterium]
MKLKSFLFAILVSFLLATITPPIFTSYAKGPPQTSVVTKVAESNPDSVCVYDTTKPAPSPWIDPTKLPASNPGGIFGIGAERLVAYLTGLITLMLMMFPTVSSSKWYLWIFDLLAFFIPNFKSGGGVHQINLFYSLYKYFFKKA